MLTLRERLYWAMGTQALEFSDVTRATKIPFTTLLALVDDPDVVPDPEMIDRIANYLDVATEWLLTGNGSTKR
jgi:hypothetical protein